MWMRIKSIKARQVRKEESIYLELEYLEAESSSRLVQLLELFFSVLGTYSSAVPSPF